MTRYTGSLLAMATTGQVQGDKLTGKEQVAQDGQMQLTHAQKEGKQGGWRSETHVIPKQVCDGVCKAISKWN